MCGGCSTILPWPVLLVLLMLVLLLVVLVVLLMRPLLACLGPGAGLCRSVGRRCAPGRRLPELCLLLRPRGARGLLMLGPGCEGWLLRQGWRLLRRSVISRPVHSSSYGCLQHRRPWRRGRMCVLRVGHKITLNAPSPRRRSRPYPFLARRQQLHCWVSEANRLLDSAVRGL